jgi:hypothetical protein
MAEVWVECYDPIVEETYYYCHASGQCIYETPDGYYITAKEDPIMNAAVKIQCLGRRVSHTYKLTHCFNLRSAPLASDCYFQHQCNQRIAVHRVQKLRFKDSVAFKPDFCSGPADVVAGGMGIQRAARGSQMDIMTALAGGKCGSLLLHRSICCSNGSSCAI